MKWGPAEVETWYRQQTIKRSYQDELLTKIEALRTRFDVHAYGALSLDPDRYPLFLLKSKAFTPTKKTILITGGVHGYETSGVHGALKALERASSLDAFNIVCVPCVSPWAYETINRWNPKAIDPNRSFVPESPAEECRLFLDAMTAHSVRPFAHFDLHETTDTDETVFRPALEQRDGVTHEPSPIPDGFYLVGESDKPQPEFQRAIIASVRRITHIAPDQQILGVAIEQEGVINYPGRKIGLCMGYSDAAYVTTTEVYPDSPRLTDAICVEAQVAAVEGWLKYLLGQS